MTSSKIYHIQLHGNKKVNAWMNKIANGRTKETKTKK